MGMKIMKFHLCSLIQMKIVLLETKRKLKSNYYDYLCILYLLDTNHFSHGCLFVK